MINDFVGKLVADKYRIESLIRESESGDFYLGRHEVSDRPATVKILSSAFAVDARWVKRFIAKARSASGVTHPNILNISDFGTDAKGISYAVFEPADGQTLRNAIDGENPFDEKRALDIARQIAAAVNAGHEKKIIHGGLDPKNIFINEGDMVKVQGFGGDPMYVARDADPRYLAPEQCTAFPAADERSDVYALGVILFEMLSGTVPYNGQTAADVLAKQNSEPPPPLSAFGRELHPEIEPVALSAIAAEPERRYPNMAAFVEDLEILAGHIGIPEKAEAAAAATPKRNIWQTAFVAFAGIAILAVALIYATSVKKTTDPTTQLVADVGSLPVQPIGPATGAQEESLARLPAMTEAEILATSMSASDDLPGGDGYNAWANGGIPPVGAPQGVPLAGAPLNQDFPPYYVPHGGQIYTIDPNGGSQFMPQEGGVILIPIPANTEPAAKPSPSPKTPAANTATQPTPAAAATPKPLATPPSKSEKPVSTQPKKEKPAPAGNSDEREAAQKET